MTILDAVHAARGSLLKARRIYMKANKLTSDGWYQEWPHTAYLWNAYAGVKF